MNNLVPTKNLYLPLALKSSFTPNHRYLSLSKIKNHKTIFKVNYWSNHHTSASRIETMSHTSLHISIKHTIYTHYVANNLNSSNIHLLKLKLLSDNVKMSLSKGALLRITLNESTTGCTVQLLGYKPLNHRGQ